MQKLLIKYLQTEFNNTSKISYIMINLFSFQGCKMVQHIQISKCNRAHKQNQDKNHRIISIDAEKVFEKIQHPFIIKDLKKLEIEGKYLNIIKAIYDKCTAYIILNGEKLKSFPLKLGMTQGYPLSPLFNSALEFLARGIKKKK
jgi:hypothetical protein